MSLRLWNKVQKVPLLYVKGKKPIKESLVYNLVNGALSTTSPQRKRKSPPLRGHVFCA